MYIVWQFNYLLNIAAWIVDLTIKKVRFSDCAQKVLLHKTFRVGVTKSNRMIKSALQAKGIQQLIGFKQNCPINLNR